MHTLILKSVSREKSVSMSFFTTNNNTVVIISNLAPPAWNWITRFDTNYLMFCLFGDTLSFMMFSLFSSAVSNAIHLCNAYNIFLMKRQVWNELDTCCPLDKIQDGREYLHNLMSSKSFHIYAKKPQDKWVDWTFSKPKGKFFMEIILSSKYLWKHNRFSILIVNMWDSKCMTYLELSFDVTDGHGLKWCIKMDKLFVLI